jgi:hypothetical protein
MSGPARYASPFAFVSLGIGEVRSSNSPSGNEICFVIDTPIFCKKFVSLYLNGNHNTIKEIINRFEDVL